MKFATFSSTSIMVPSPLLSFSVRAAGSGEPSRTDASSADAASAGAISLSESSMTASISSMAACMCAMVQSACCSGCGSGDADLVSTAGARSELSWGDLARKRKRPGMHEWLFFGQNSCGLWIQMGSDAIQVAGRRTCEDRHERIQKARSALNNADAALKISEEEGCGLVEVILWLSFRFFPHSFRTNIYPTGCHDVTFVLTNYLTHIGRAVKPKVYSSPRVVEVAVVFSQPSAFRGNGY